MEFINMKEVLLSRGAAALLFADALPNTYPVSGERLALTGGGSWERRGLMKLPRHKQIGSNSEGEEL